MSNNDLIELGTSNKPHGIKGGFLFKLENTTDSVLSKKSKITLFPLSAASSIDKAGEVFEIANIHFGNKTICYLKDITDRNIVEGMLPFSIHYPRSLFPQTAEDEFYVNDLIGLKVLNTQGHEVGRVEGQYDNGVQTVLKLKINNQIIELPFVENFFPEVNMEKRTITFIPPEFDE